MNSKALEIMGRPATFFGRAGDDYFDRLPAYVAQNTLLLEELSKLPADAHIIDVGAHIGVTAVMCSRVAMGGKVLAIEPSPASYADLVRSLDASGATNCTPIQACIGRSKGTVPFLQEKFLGGVTALRRGAQTIDVPLTTIDALVSEKRWSRLDLVKIDVDGPEFDVLNGALEMFQRFNPRIVMEFSPFCLAWYGNISPRAVLDFILKRYGSFDYIRDGVRKTVSNEEDAKHFLFSSMSMLSVLTDDLAFGGA